MNKRRWIATTWIVVAIVVALSYMLQGDVTSAAREWARGFGASTAGTDAGVERQVARGGGSCPEPKVQEAPSGDEAKVFIPNCRAESRVRLSATPEGYAWTCTPNTSVVKWSFRDRPGEFLVTGTSHAKETEVLAYPDKDVRPFGLRIEVKGNWLTAQWNVRVKPKRKAPEFWNDQDSGARVTCRMEPGK